MIKKLYLLGYLDITKMLLEAYRLLDLKESEFLLILHLLEAIKANNKLIKASAFAKKLNKTTLEIEEVLASLMKKGFLEIKMAVSKSGVEQEEFSLDPLFSTLERLYGDQEKEEPKIDMDTEALKVLLDFFQNYYGRILTPLEIQTIEMWNGSGITAGEVRKVLVNDRVMTIKEINKKLILNEGESPKEIAKKDQKTKRQKNLEEFFNSIKK